VSDQTETVPADPGEAVEVADAVPVEAEAAAAEDGAE
jgi:hypothetical protein